MHERPDTVFPAAADLPARLQLWRPEARAELLTHLAELGLTDIQNAAEDILTGEAERARAWDPRARDSDARRFTKLARRAQSLVPAPQTFLTGFTRGVDAKLRLEPDVLEGLVEALSADERPRLLDAIEHGPGARSVTGSRMSEVAWTEPKDPVELLAGLVRHLALDSAAALRLTLGASLVTWTQRALDGLGVRLQLSAGGAGLFVANLASAFPQTRALSFAPGPLSPALVARCGARVQWMCPDGALRGAAAWADTSESTRVSFCIEYAARAFTLLGQLELVARRRPGGERRVMPFVAKHSGRAVLAPAGSPAPSFGETSPAVLRGIGGEVDTFFFGGAHEYTRESEAACRAHAEALAAAVGYLREGNPRLWSHFEYAAPRNPDHERALMESLRGTFDSMDLSSREAGPLLARMGVSLHGCFGVAAPWNPEWDAAEHPGRMLEAGEALIGTLGVRQVQLHGELGDVMVVAGAADMEKLLLALVKARQVASNKAANQHGEVRSSADLWPVVPVADAKGLAGLHVFADAVAERFSLSAVQREGVVERFRHTDRASGLTFLFAPGRGLHHADGGKTGIGDTIGGVVQLCGRVPVRAVATAHSA